MARQPRTPRWQGHGIMLRDGQAVARNGDVTRLILGILAIVLTSALVALATGELNALPSMPFTADSSSAVPRVLAVATTWSGGADDPPITLPSGTPVKASNYDGV